MFGVHITRIYTAQIFFSRCEQIQTFLQICSYLKKKLSIKNFIFCAMLGSNRSRKRVDWCNAKLWCPNNSSLWQFVLNSKEVSHHLKFRRDQWNSYTHINAEIVDRKSTSKEKIKRPVSLPKLNIKASDLHQVRIPRFMLESLYHITCDMI